MQSMVIRIVVSLAFLALLPEALGGQTSVFLGAPALPGLHAAPAAEAESGELAVLGDAALASAEAVDRLMATMTGYSGSLRAVVVDGEAPGLIDSPVMPVRWVEIFPDRPGILGEPVRSESTDEPEGPGVYLVERVGLDPDRLSPLPIAVITTVPFEEKRSGYINGYYLGRYPTEGEGRRDAYAPPARFIEVTPENQDFSISEHFRLRQFLTKDQGSVWPKYLALELRLIDKLELVLQELRAMGLRADAMHVMSGFRTPQYNGPGGNGRASLSRHTYGDAADVWVDSDGNGYMDDLNGDGRADLDDARVMMVAVERVERRYPELIGGAGVYVANSAHGPFIHIDVRGSRARW